KYPKDKTVTKKSLSVVLMPGKTTWQVKQSGRNIAVTSDKIKVNLNLENGQTAFLTNDGRTRLLNEKDAGTIFTPFDDAGESTWSVAQTFELDKDEAIYGLGQQQRGRMIQRNCKLRMVQGNTDDYVPFFQSVKGYGIFWDNY